MISNERLRCHYESLSRAITFVRSTDTKAAPLLAAQLALVGTLAAMSENLWAILGSPPWDAERILLVLLITAYGLIQLWAVTLAALVYMPMNPRTGASLIYFEDISSMEYEGFEERAMAMSPRMVEQQLLDQIHRISQIASTKMGKVRLAFQLSGVSGLMWVTLLIWGIIRA